jgi:hypothetical protein
MNRETWYKASFGLNAFLAAVVVLLAVRQHVPEPPTGAAVAEANLTPPTEPNPVASRRDAPLMSAARPTATSNWEAWIEQLRAAGAPDKVLARVVLASFDERWERRFDEVQQKFNRGEVDYEALSTLSRERDREQERELRNTLGEEGFKRWDQENTLRFMNLTRIPLTASETNALYDLHKGLQQQFRDLEQARDAGEMDDADFNERQNRAQAEYDQRLKTLLGDKRYATMQGLDDVGAGELRRNLRSVNASDAQFEALLQAQREWTERRAELDRQLQSNQSLNIAYEDQIKALDQARDLEYQRVLGTNAFDTFQKSQDARYVKMKRYANTWGIDDASIDYIYGTLKYYEKSIEDYQQQARALEEQGQTVDWDAVNHNLHQSYLGQERYGRLKRNELFSFEYDQ